MAYSPENNPYIPGDPYSYDLKWLVKKVNEWKDPLDSAERAKASEEAAEASALAAHQSEVNAKSNADAILPSVVQLTDRVSASEEDLTTLEARMDTFSLLPDASTAGDAELADIRVGANGITYPNAGDAVRGQYTENHNLITSMEAELRKKIDYELGTNIFNKDEANRKAGVYANSATGTINTNASYTVIMTEVEAGQHISCNKSGVHICFLSQITDLTSVSVGYQLPGYISGVNATLANPIIDVAVPAGAIVMTVSANTSDLASLQIEYGASVTPYSPYVKGLSADKIIGLSENIITVGAGHDYTTIQAAVDVAPDNSIIYIMNGVYDEAVDIKTSGKYLVLIGESRDGTILTHDGSYYSYPPLEISRGRVENMTIIRTGNVNLEDNGAYCVHADYFGMAASSIQFKNVRFINTITACVGIGLRNNSRVSFLDCDFECGASEVFYCHEQQADDISGQYVELINCTLKQTGNGYVIRLQETPSFTNNSATIRMQRNIVKNSAHPSNIIWVYQIGANPPGLIYGGYLGSKVWTLDDMSALNNENILNS